MYRFCMVKLTHVQVSCSLRGSRPARCGFVPACDGRFPWRSVFRQERIGLNGKKIRIWKIRTMVTDAHTNPERYMTPPTAGAVGARAEGR